jgi:peroxiredoxin Q/BCP
MKSLNQMEMLNMPAPDFTLRGHDGRMHSLSDYKGSWVILYFYPKDMTPGCTLEAEEFRDHSYELGDLNATVVGISTDDVASHKKFCEQANLNFDLLSDEDGEVCRLYDVWREKNMFGTKQFGIERTTFLIGPEGKVRKIYGKVKPLGHAEAVIKDLEKLVEEA